MDAIAEVHRMASIGGISLDVMTAVLRASFTEDQIREAYAVLDQYDSEMERGIPIFYPRPS